MKKAPIVLLFALAAVAILSLTSTAAAVTIHQHSMIDRGFGPPLEVVRVVQVAPADGDDDGCRNSEDDYNGPGCQPPPPPPEPTTVPSTVPTVAAPVSSGGCPSYMSGEASSPDAVNPSSGAAGCYQVLPSTAAAMGSACADVNSTSCLGAICAAQGNDAWVAADPCGYATLP